MVRGGGGAYNTIAIYDEENNYTTVYLHASEVNPKIVGNDKYVQVGTWLGIQGDRGSADAYHVHVEVRPERRTAACPDFAWGVHESPTDPIPYLYERVAGSGNRVVSPGFTVSAIAHPSNDAGRVEIAGGDSVDVDKKRFERGARVEWDAVSFSGWEFSHWVACRDGTLLDWRGTVPSISVARVSNDWHLEAHFTRVATSGYAVSASVHPGDGAGYVEITGEELNRTDENRFEAGERANWEAIPFSGWEFSYWVAVRDGTRLSWRGTDRSVYVNSVNTNWHLEAHFVRVSLGDYRLTVVSTPSDSGQVLVHNGEGTTPGERWFDTGDVARIQPVASSGWCFSHWSFSWQSWTSTWDGVFRLTISASGEGTMTANFVRC